jgi:hypothetical protein
MSMRTGYNMVRRGTFTAMRSVSFRFTSRLLLATFISLTVAAWTVLPVRAGQVKSVDWHAYDTGRYVVSTINVLHPIGGRAAAVAFHDDLGLGRYAVLADTLWHDRYFIQLQRSSGITVGALEYALGWPNPRSVTRSIDRLGVQPAAGYGRHAYYHDPKQLLGIYNSTLPQ